MKENRAESYNVKVFFRYCCQILIAFIHIDLKLAVSSKYNWIFAEKKLILAVKINIVKFQQTVQIKFRELDKLLLSDIESIHSYWFKISCKQ